MKLSLEERIFRLESELRDVKTRLTKIDGKGDLQRGRPAWCAMPYLGDRHPRVDRLASLEKDSQNRVFSEKPGEGSR